MPSICYEQQFITEKLFSYEIKRYCKKPFPPIKISSWLKALRKMEKIVLMNYRKACRISLIQDRIEKDDRFFLQDIGDYLKFRQIHEFIAA